MTPSSFNWFSFRCVLLVFPPLIKICLKFLVTNYLSFNRQMQWREIYQLYRHSEPGEVSNSKLKSRLSNTCIIELIDLNVSLKLRKQIKQTNQRIL